MKRVIILILTVLILIPSVTVYTYGFEYTQIANYDEWMLLDLINQKRRDAVTMFVDLQNSARTRSKELLSELSHYRSDGSAWYTVLTDNGIGYDVDSYEIIGANFNSADAFLKAVLKSDMADRLLNNGYHIGIGYSSSSDTKNKNAWCIIGVSCDGIDSIALHYRDVHFDASGKKDTSKIVLEAVCQHKKSYMQLLPYMVSGYNKDMIGTQVITVSYRDKTAELLITNDYKDVKPGKWFYDPIMNCTEQGYYSGVGNGNFSPTGQMTREMFVTVLGRLAGIDASKHTGTNFKDVKADRWSAPYIKWASDNGIVSGYNDGTFAPSKGITRQEMCSVVKRYLDRFDITVDATNIEKTFTDSNKIASWAKEAVVFCQTRGIISGDNNGAFNPTQTATRAEVAVIITNLDKVIK